MKRENNFRQQKIAQLSRIFQKILAHNFFITVNVPVFCIMSPVSCLVSPSLVKFLLYSVSCLTNSVSCLTPPVQRFGPTSPVSHLLSHILHLLSHVSCLLYHFSFFMCSCSHICFEFSCFLKKEIWNKEFPCQCQVQMEVGKLTWFFPEYNSSLICGAWTGIEAKT